jgi:hypothetical protein
MDVPLDSIDDRALQGLIEREVREGRVIEYKSALPGRADGDRVEFLADVSSFANASGGDILYGIKEQGGAPVEICGVGDTDLDAEIRRLESMMRDGIDARMPGVACRGIQTNDGKWVIAIRVPQSWAGPHMVTLKQHSRFYSRNSAGKYALDVQELRSAFAASEAVGERIRQFRLERIGKIMARETPVPLVARAMVVLHILPLASFAPGVRRDLISEGADARGLQTLHGGLFDWRYNFDGLLGRDTPGEAGECSAYTQVFRDGRIESVSASMLGQQGRASKYIPSEAFERRLLEGTLALVRYADLRGITPPLALGATLIYVRGARMAVSNRLEEGSAIDREVLHVAEVLYDGHATNISPAMRPCFDAIWNACGFRCSPNFTQTGEWNPR